MCTCVKVNWLSSVTRAFGGRRSFPRLLVFIFFSTTFLRKCMVVLSTFINQGQYLSEIRIKHMEVKKRLIIYTSHGVTFLFPPLTKVLTKVLITTWWYDLGFEIQCHVLLCSNYQKTKPKTTQTQYETFE